MPSIVAVWGGGGGNCSYLTFTLCSLECDIFSGCDITVHHLFVMFQYTPRSLGHLVEVKCIIYFSHILYHFSHWNNLTRRNKRPFSPINCYISSRWYILPSCEISYGYNEMSVFAQTVRFSPFDIFYPTATFFLSVTIDPGWTCGMQWDCRLFTRLNFQIVEKIFSQSTRAEWNYFLNKIILK